MICIGLLWLQSEDTVYKRQGWCEDKAKPEKQIRKIDICFFPTDMLAALLLKIGF